MSIFNIYYKINLCSSGPPAVGYILSIIIYYWYIGLYNNLI